jgi:hypothetical protein
MRIPSNQIQTPRRLRIDFYHELNEFLDILNKRPFSLQQNIEKYSVYQKEDSIFDKSNVFKCPPEDILLEKRHPPVILIIPKLRHVIQVATKLGEFQYYGTEWTPQGFG